MSTFNAGTVQADIAIDKGKLQSSVSDAIGEFRRLGSEGEQAGEDAGKRTGSALGEGLAGGVDLSLEGIGDKIKGKLSGLTEGGAGIGKLAGAGVGLALVGGLVAAISFEPARAKLTAQLGLTQEESGRIGGVAGKLFAANYGESFGDVTEALRSVIQNVDGMRNASDADLQAMTGKVMSLSSAFDQDLGATTRAVGQLMRTGLAKDGDEALDIIAKGFQTGADKSEDFLDTLNEYGTQFRKLGIDGKEATGLIEQGLKAGARDADIVADAFKEFSIRAVDGSKLTATSLTQLGLNAEAVSGQIAKGGGTAKAATDQVLDALRAVPDPAQRSAIAVGLFGTQAEDLGQALFALDLSTASDQLGDVAGAAAQVDAAMGDTAAGGLESISRGFQVAADTLGQALLPVIKPIIVGIVTLVGAVGDLVGQVVNLPGPLLAIAAAIGGWLLFGTVATAVVSFGEALGVAAVAVRGFLSALGPIGIIIAGITIAMSFLMDTSGELDDTIQAQTDRWDRLVATLDKVSGAVTEATVAQLAQEAQQSGMLDTLEGLGVSTADYIAASTGAAGASERFGASVASAASKILSQSEAYQAVAADIAAAGVSQAQFVAAMEQGDITAVQAKVDAYAESVARISGNASDATRIQEGFAAAVAEGQAPLEALGGALNISGADASGFSDAAKDAAQTGRAMGDDAAGAAAGVDGLGTAAAGAADALSPMDQALKDAKDSTSALDSATQFLQLTLDQAAGNIITNTQATNAYDAAQRGIAGSQRDTADAAQTLSDAQSALSTMQNEGGHTAADLEAAERKVADASDAVSDAQAAQTDANVKVQQTAIAQAVALANTAAANGDLKGATDVATASLQRSKDAFIAAQPEADRLTGKAQQTADALFGVPAAVSTTLTENGAISVQSAAHETAGAVNSVPDNKTVSFNTNANTVIGELNTLAGQIRSLDGSVINIERRVTGTALVAAEGGAVTSPGVKGVDSVPYILAPGEHVFDDGDVDKLGGQGNTYGLRKALEAGGITGAAKFLMGLSGAVAAMPGLSGGNAPAAAPSSSRSSSGAQRVVTVGAVSIGRFDDAHAFFDRMAWEQVG